MTHAGYIFAAYAFTALVVAALMLRTILQHRALRAVLDKLEGRR